MKAKNVIIREDAPLPPGTKAVPVRKGRPSITLLWTY